jgi:hypothetical protein
MNVSDYDYDLPEELIAHRPCPDRAGSRMLVLSRATGDCRLGQFREFPSLLRAGDCLVLNDTKVIPARLFGRRQGFTGRVEAFLLEPVGTGCWRSLLKPGRRMKAGTVVEIEGTDKATFTVVEANGDGTFTIAFQCADVDALLEQAGHIPLPPYIARPDEATDKDRYQTVYAERRGAVAAPTAGLHFTPEILAEIAAKGIQIVRVTLHVGAGTAKIHRPEVAPNAESPPPLLTYYFMNALLGVLEMMLPGGMSDSGISKKFQAEAFPKLVLPSLEAEGLERGLFQLTVTATAEGARKMGLDPRAFPIEIDPAAGYTSEGPGVFLDPRAELEGTAEQQAFFLEGDDLKGSYEAAGVYIALGYLDWDRGMKGLGYGVKLMSLEPSMTDYLAKSAFGRTYANRASRLFQPYLMQDEAEAAVAERLGPDGKGFTPDPTLALCEDVRDENSGLPPDKGYRLYSANSGTAKFDFEVAPSDADFVETDDFSEDDPVGPDGPVRLLVRSKSRMKLEEEEIAGEEGFADFYGAAAARGGAGGTGFRLVHGRCSIFCHCLLWLLACRLGPLQVKGG